MRKILPFAVLVASLGQARELPDSSVIFKGGGANYTGTLGQYTAIGPSYGLALNVQPLNYIGFEIGYDGSQNQLQTLRFPEYQRAAFWRNGASALLKICAPLESIRPFAGVGFGLGWVSVSGSRAGGAFHGDLMGQLPLTIGVEVYADRFVAGMRATYWVLLDEGFVHVNGSNALGGILDLQSTIGVRF